MDDFQINDLVEIIKSKQEDKIIKILDNGLCCVTFDKNAQIKEGKLICCSLYKSTQLVKIN